MKMAVFNKNFKQRLFLHEYRNRSNVSEALQKICGINNDKLATTRGLINDIGSF